MKEILLSRTNPDGATLEDVLTALAAEITNKSKMVMNPSDAVTKQVVHNNAKIIAKLNECLALQTESMKLVTATRGSGDNTISTGNFRI